MLGNKRAAQTHQQNLSTLLKQPPPPTSSSSSLIMMPRLSYSDYCEQENSGGDADDEEGLEQLNANDIGADDIATRLQHQLRLGVMKELELSHEILRINDQLQEDELLAMQSIYDDNMTDRAACELFRFKLEQFYKQLPCVEKVVIVPVYFVIMQIQVHIESPKDLTISTRRHASSDYNGKHVDPPEIASHSFKVQYLPPIVLTCLLPQSYPSHLPPCFTISVQWLDTSAISNVCFMIDTIWKEQPGQEVIYQWVEWLRTSSLSHLGFDEVIVLGPNGTNHVEDRRAISGCVSLDVVIPSMKSYNDDQCGENFRRNLHDCSICFNEYAGTEFIRLPYKHFFCTPCMKTFANMHVKEGTVVKLLCPESKCGGLVPPGLLKQLLGDEEFERRESLMLEKALDTMSDVTYCPRCETPCIEDEDHHAQCSKCFFSFCTLCMERRHIGVVCMTPDEKLLVLQKRQNSTRPMDKQKRREQAMIAEILSVQAIMRDSKQCPRCKMAITRTEGCNKMVCYKCGVRFCYRCNQQIDGYDHYYECVIPSAEFKIDPYTCLCFLDFIFLTLRKTNQFVLIEGTDANSTNMTYNSEDRMNERRIVNGIQIKFHGNSHPCPLCGEPNAKVGDSNDIICWACQKRYCYSCKKMVKRYGPPCDTCP